MDNELVAQPWATKQRQQNTVIIHAGLDQNKTGKKINAALQYTHKGPQNIAIIINQPRYRNDRETLICKVKMLIFLLILLCYSKSRLFFAIVLEQRPQKA